MGSRHRAFVTSHAHRYDELLARQRGRCAICGAPPKTRRLHIDHDHKTMEIRGLLCHRCNRALATWVTPEWLHAAAAYLNAARMREVESARKGSGASACWS